VLFGKLTLHYKPEDYKNNGRKESVFGHLT